ncbi:Villin headpiece domain containing protein [Balamuthia mandrillaris]
MDMASAGYGSFFPVSSEPDTGSDDSSYEYDDLRAVPFDRAIAAAGGGRAIPAQPKTDDDTSEFSELEPMAPRKISNRGNAVAQKSLPGSGSFQASDSEDDDTSSFVPSRRSTRRGKSGTASEANRQDTGQNHYQSYKAGFTSDLATERVTMSEFEEDEEDPFVSATESNNTTYAPLRPSPALMPRTSTRTQSSRAIPQALVEDPDDDLSETYNTFPDLSEWEGEDDDDDTSTSSNYSSLKAVGASLQPQQQTNGGDAQQLQATASGAKSSRSSSSSSGSRRKKKKGGAEDLIAAASQEMALTSSSGAVLSSSGAASPSGLTSSGKMSKKELKEEKKKLRKTKSDLKRNKKDSATPPPKTAKKCKKKVMEIASLVKGIILAICSKAKTTKAKGGSRNSPKVTLKISSGDLDRLKYLYETVHLITIYVSCQTKAVLKIHAYAELLTALYDALFETKKMVESIKKGEVAITENFDIFEMTLRKYLEQLNRMFPLESDAKPLPDPPSSLIEDARARQVWETQIGCLCHYTTFDHFVASIIKVEFPEAGENPEFIKYIKYFVNFPDDNMVTTYKWNLLIRLFGPYEQFAQNFKGIVMEKGFLGLINRIKANEILQLSPHLSCVLMVRFSRTEPEFLAFSFKDEEGNINHSLNKDDDDPQRIVPVSEYIKKKFDGFKLVGQRVKVFGDVATDLGLYEYAKTSVSDAYIIPDMELIKAAAKKGGK